MCPIYVRLSRGISIARALNYVSYLCQIIERNLHAFPFLIHHYSFPVMESTFVSVRDCLNGAGHATSQKEQLGTCGLWWTTLGSALVLRTRAEPWVFPHNPRPLVFFLLHNPQISSLCSLSCLNPKVLLRGI